MWQSNEQENEERINKKASDGCNGRKKRGKNRKRDNRRCRLKMNDSVCAICVSECLVEGTEMPRYMCVYVNCYAIHMARKK